MAKAVKEREVTGWVGWVYFASVMMMVVGGLQALSGFVALFKDDFYVVAPQSLLVFNYTAWGWTHIVLGLLVFFAGLAVASGKMWGRVIGIIMTIVNALTNLAFMPAYPLWGIIALVIDGLVLYALTVHGAEAKEDE